MADKRISDAAAVTTETTVYVPGGAGGQPLKVPTTAAGRALMGAADAAAQRAALELDARYPRLGADNEYGGVQTVTDGVTGTVTVGPGQIVVESVGEEPSQTVITTSSVSSGQFVGDGSLLTGLTAGQVVGLAAAAESAAAAAVTAHAAGAGVHPVAGVAGLQSALDAKQPLDADLTAIAALDPAGQDGKVLGVEAGEWAFVDGGAAAAAIVSHVADGNPHTQYARTAAANTFTGALTAAAGLTLSGPSGLALRVAAPSGTAGRFFTVSSSHNSSNGGDDEATFLGANYSAQQATNRGRIDATRGAAMLGIESMYKAYVGAPYQDEFYFQTVTDTNKVYRSIMSELRWDGTAANYIGGNLYLIPVLDNDVGVGAPDWSYDSSDGSLSSYGKVLVQRSNNVGWLQQWDSTGTPQNLIYLDGSNVTQVGSAGGVTMAGPVRTTWSLLNSSGLTLNNAVPVRAYDSGGANPINLISREAGGSITVGTAGYVVTHPGQTSLTHTPVYNGDAPLIITTTMGGANSSNYYGMKVAATFNATNSGSVHYLAQFAGNSTYAANGPTVTAVRANLTANAASAYLPDATGFEYQGGVNGGFIGVQTGIKIKTPTATGGGFHSTTFYGVQVEDVTGPTNPYSIYTGAGWVRLGDGTAGSRFGAFGATPVVRPVLSYDRSDAGETAAVAAIRAALAALGWVDDQTTA